MRVLGTSSLVLVNIFVLVLFLIHILFVVLVLLGQFLLFSCFNKVGIGKSEFCVTLRLGSPGSP